MGRRKKDDIAHRDLRPDEWRQLAKEYSTLPKTQRAEFLREVASRTTLSRATVHRRFSGRFPSWQKPGRKPASSAEQRQLVVTALERFHGRISATELWMDVLGAPVSPSLQTVRRLCSQWRCEQLARRQVPDVRALVAQILAQTSQVALPLGPDRPTMFATAKQPRTDEDVARDAMGVLLRSGGGR